MLDGTAVVLGRFDGLWAENLAIREHRGKGEVFVGTDDENYGGILRVMPIEVAQ